MDRVDELLSLLQGVTPQSDGKWKAICPAHEDQVASLSVGRGDNGTPVLHCHAGCKTPNVLYAVGKTMGWLFPDHGLPEGYRSSKSSRPKGTCVGTYSYHDQFGALLYQSQRFEDWEGGERKKTFTQRRPNGTGGWIYNMTGVHKVPYRLPELIKSHESEYVYIVEGEKHVDRLAEWGLVATCNVGGAGKWLKEYSKWLFGRKVVLLADNDEPGKKHIAKVAESLKGIADFVVAVDLPGLPPKGDVLDWIAAGGTADALKQLTAMAVIAGMPIEAPPPPEGPSEEKDRETLDKLRLRVVKENEQGHIKVYSKDCVKDTWINDVSKLQFTKLLQACGPVVRDVVYNGNDSTPKDMVRLSDVKQAIALAAADKRDRKSLGAGVWEGDEGKSIILVGEGEAAVLDATGSVTRIDDPEYGDYILELGSSEQWFGFEELKDRIDNYLPSWGAAMVDELEAVFQGWWYGDAKQAVMPPLLSGLVLATWLQSIWKWRPQVFILGKSNSGKTTLFEFLAGGQHTLGIFGNLVVSSGDATAAGIAQAVESTSKVIILDEMENSKKRTGVFELLRNSGRGGKRLRGTPAQKKAETGIQHITWSAATESGLKKEVDRNRFVIVNLLTPPPEKMGQLQKVIPPEEGKVDLGQRLLAVAVKTAFRAVELSQYLNEHRPHGYHYRVVESYSAPAAAYAAAQGMDEVQAVRLLEEFLGSTDPEEIEGDEHRLLNAIAQHIMPVKGGERYSVAQALLASSGKTDLGKDSYVTSVEADWSLKSHGIYLLDNPRSNETWIDGETKCVFLQTAAVDKNILRHDREWDGINSKEILLRIPRAVACKKRVGGGHPPGVLLPFSVMFGGGHSESLDLDLQF